jgi:cell division protein FtsI/penicillin-binding protein 2
MNNEKNNILPRLAIVYIILLLVFVIPIIYTIFHLQFVDEEVKRYAKENSLRWSDVNARRGSIYSSDDKILSTSIPVYDVSIDLVFTKNANL